MRKMLFVSNISRKITNFALPSILAAQKLGYEVHLAANCSAFDDDERKYGVVLHHLDIDRNICGVSNWRAFRQMVSLLKVESYDFIHCNTPVGGVLGRVGSQVAGVPKVIYTAHGFHFWRGAPILNRVVYESAERLMAHYTDALITINKEDFEAARAFRLRRGGTVYYVPGVGIDINRPSLNRLQKERIRMELGLRASDTVLIAMGYLIPGKNYEVSIAAVAKLKDPSVHFLICGEGPLLGQLRSLAQRLGVSEQIHFLGYRTDVEELLQISDVFFFTSLREGLPRSLMEAMNAGLPCVVSSVRGNVDLIRDGEGGYLRRPDDSRGFAESLRVLASDSALRRAMGVANMEHIKAYSVERVIQSMIGIYEKELASAPLSGSSGR